MRGNSHVRFLGEGVAVTPPPYPVPVTTPRVFGIRVVMIPWIHTGRVHFVLPMDAILVGKRRYVSSPLHFRRNGPGQPSTTLMAPTLRAALKWY